MKVGNTQISVTFSAESVALTSIRNEEAPGHDYLSAASMLFGFTSNNGRARRSDRDLIVDNSTLSPDGSELTIRAHARHEQLEFVITAKAERAEAVVAIAIRITNTGDSHIFLRMQMPKIRNLVTAGPRRMGAVPTELGSVAPLANGAFLGMELKEREVGLPNTMNSMEVASVYDENGGGVFFADMDGDVDNGVAPIQLTLSEFEVTGFWTANLSPGASNLTPRLAIGVHTAGDWHAAVDYYLSKHRTRWQFPSIPSWFRDQGAIYAVPGFGAGGIYLSLPAASLGDGIPWVTFSVNDGPWTDLDHDRGHPVEIGPTGFAPPGAHLAMSRQRGGRQLDVFAVGNDGAVWVTFTVDDGPWTNKIEGRTPFRISPVGFAPPGAPLAVATQRGGRQLDVFTVRNDGAVWVTFTVDDGPWTDGNGGRTPMRVSPLGFAPPGARLAVATQRGGRQLDVFTVRNDGAVWVTFTVDDGPWTDGNGGRTPFRVSPLGFAPPGAPLAVTTQRGGRQLDVFTVRNDGAVWVTFTVDDGPWTDGNGGRAPMRVSPLGFAPPGAHLAVTRQRGGRQLDVFTVGNDGAVWVTFTVDDGAWTDGIGGRTPFRVSPVGFAPPGAPLAVATQRGGRQLDVFTVRNDGAVWVTFTVDDGPWTDDVDGRKPMRVSPAYVGGGPLPPAAHLAVANQSNGRQLDVFSVGKGLIKSFHELPKFLQDARALGTNIVYLADYWEGADGGDPRYWNKGDYMPRADLGGEAAFIDGIRRIKEGGGRTILYLEPFIIYKSSLIARQHGLSWAGRRPLDDKPYEHYAKTFTMAPPLVDWQSHIVNVARRLVKNYSADGIFLDSWAWQMNWPMKTRQDGRVWSSLEFSQGVLRLTALVRRAVREENAEAVVIGETTAGPVGRYWDGGLCADFGFAARPGNPRQLTASPVRYGIGEFNWFGNGTNLNELHQVFAAGHSLALSGFWPGSFMHVHAAHIRALVQLRQNHKDALIHGRQTYQPKTGNDAVVAYRYRGDRHQMITLVNTAEAVDHVVTLTLRDDDRNSTWSDLLSPLVISANGNLLGPVPVPRSGLRVLLRS